MGSIGKIYHFNMFTAGLNTLEHHSVNGETFYLK